MTAAMLACAVGMLASARLACAFELGEVEVRSALGQPLRLRIPYQLARDEAIDASCVRVLPAPAASSGIPAILKVNPSLQSQAGRNYIGLESPQAANDPAATLTVEVRCGSIATTRGFVILFDPPERLAASAADPVKTTAGAGTQAAQPVSELPAAKPARVRASGAGARPARIQAGEIAPGAPAVPQTSAVVRSARRIAAQGRPVLRIDAAPEDSDGQGGARDLCCFRLSYELADRNVPPLTEDQREQLRQEMQERMSDEDPIARLLAVRNDLAMLKKQLTASAKELAVAQARYEQQAKEARAAREYVFYAVYFVVAIALALALWQWLRMKRIRAAKQSERYRAFASKPDIAPADDRISILGPDAGDDMPDVGPDDPISILGPEFHMAQAQAAAAPPEFHMPAARDATARAPLDFDLSKDATAADLSSTIALDLPADLDFMDQTQRAEEYQKAYMLARFPGIAAGNIELHRPASVIEAARIFLEDDHDAAKAEELLRIALAAHPEHVHLWLALFEMFSRERMALEFSELARRYRDARDIRTDKYWPMIAKLGRELEPENELYDAAGLPPADGPHPNWLNSQLDMMGDVLAIDLRTQMLEQRDKLGPAKKE